MARFKFRLEPVLRHRERQKLLAEARERQAAAVLQAREAEAGRLRAELDRAANPADLTGWLARQRHAAALGARLAAAEAVAGQARDAYLRANEERRRASVAAEALRRLRERRLAEHRAALTAAEEQRLEEIVLGRWAAVGGPVPGDLAEELR